MLEPSPSATPGSLAGFGVLIRALGVARRRVLLHRRGLAALLVALAVAATVRELHPPPEHGREVVVATHDLAAGRRLGMSDLRVQRLPIDAVPAGAALDPGELRGRVVAGPVPRGQPVGETSVIGSSLLSRYPGQVAVGVHPVDPEVTSLLERGQRLRLLAADPTGTQPTQDLGTAVVLSTTRAGGDDPSRGPLLVLALDPDRAAAVASASAASMLAVVLLV